ncbi:MAG: 30S ribosomal protein S20 [Candidatus Pacebacteria bacterium]|nr:30S ribosomal protein S20 [Candidatus Paceibacterota bacterium]
MAITSSAKKAHKSSLNKRVFNLRRTRAMRETIKEVTSLITEKKQKEAQEMLPAVQKAIDKAAKRGVIKKNTASRKKSRIVAAIKKLSA